LHASHTGKVRYLERHLARLAASAQRLGFRCAIEQARLLIQQRLAQLPATGEFRLRLTLNRQGDFTLTHAPLAPLPNGSGPVSVLLAQELGFAATLASDPLLALKTSRRDQYDQAWQKAETLGAFDAIFTNTQGELTEGGRSNLFVKLEGRWWTPPLTSGVLPGVMRSVLLEDAQWNAAERMLKPSDLRHAEEIIVCNALRGVLAARLA
jgi:para-aminobenzoate synthetase/4-amino-4-deoxychorismate lyase